MAISPFCGHLISFAPIVGKIFHVQFQIFQVKIIMKHTIFLAAALNTDKAIVNVNGPWHVHMNKRPTSFCRIEAPIFTHELRQSMRNLPIPINSNPRFCVYETTARGFFQIVVIKLLSYGKISQGVCTIHISRASQKKH